MTDLATAADSPPVFRTVGPGLAPAPVSHRAPVKSVRASSTSSPATRTRMPRIAGLLAIAAVTYLADLTTKLAAVAALTEDTPRRLGGSGLEFRLIRNPGAAFGVGVGATVVFTVVTALVIAAILLVAHRLNSLSWAVTLGLLLGGSVGNLTDRLARAPGPFRGHVIDFVHVPGWPIFNLADGAICLSGLLIAALALRNIPLAGRRRRRR